MSTALSKQIKGLIQVTEESWISFDTFMQQALYAPGLGYYETSEVFGKKGDFLTGPDTGPWLSLGLSDLVEWGWKQLGEPAEWSLVEQGGGSGRLLADVAARLADRGVTPASLHAVERSEQMRGRQQATYASAGLDVSQHASLDELPKNENVIYLSNELPDAFPVRCFTRQGNTLLERGVGLDDAGAFRWQDRTAEMPGVLPTLPDAIVDRWPPGYFSEWNPHLAGWQLEVSRIMQRGFVFSVDYGFAQAEYYRPQRVEGTLLGHLKHEPVHEVLTDPGSRDITAHVDFTALGQAGRQAGLTMLCWITQGAWLAQSPAVQAYVQQAASMEAEVSMRHMAGAKRMLLPQGMGELFKLAVQAKGLDTQAPDYLSAFNRVDALGLDDV